MRFINFLAATPILSASMCLTLFSNQVVLAQNAPNAAMPDYVSQRDGAVDPQSITPDEAMWATFQLVSGWDSKSPGSGEQILQGAGLSAADALALSKHVHASIANVNARASDLTNNLCANTKLQPGAKQAGIQTQTAKRLTLAASLQAVDAALDDQRAKDIADMDNVISAVGKATLIEWTTKHIRPQLKITSGDYAKLFVTESIDADAEINRICGVGTENSGPTVIAH